MIRHTIYARKGPVLGILYDSSYKLAEFERRRLGIVWFIIQTAINQEIVARCCMKKRTKFLCSDPEKSRSIPYFSFIRASEDRVPIAVEAEWNTAFTNPFLHHKGRSLLHRIPLLHPPFSLPRLPQALSSSLHSSISLFTLS